MKYPRGALVTLKALSGIPRIRVERGVRAEVVRQSARTSGLTVRLLEASGAYKVGDTVNVAPYDVETVEVQADEQASYRAAWQAVYDALGCPEPDGHKTQSSMDAAVAKVGSLASALRRMLKVQEALMPGVRNIAVQNYAELNEAPLAAQRALEGVPS